MDCVKPDIKAKTVGHDIPIPNSASISVKDPIDHLNHERRQVERDVSERSGVVAVLGLGDYLAALQELRPGADLIVWEPNKEAIDLFDKSALIEKVDMERIEVVETLSGLKTALTQALVYGPAWMKAAVFVPEAYACAAPEEASKFRETVAHLKLRQASNLKTVFCRRWEWWENLCSNFGDVLKKAEASAAPGCIKGLPVVIAAAGPSLEKSIRAIRKNREVVVVLAVGTVFKRLIAEGIRPDVVVMIEGQDRADQISAEVALNDSILTVSSTTHPAHLRQRALKTVVFHSAPWIAELTGDWPFVPNGGNVASAAFTLAVLWGGNPIVLVGQDLAYSDGERYANGARSPEVRIDAAKMTQIPGNRDTGVWATSEMISYLSWYEESAKYLARVRPDIDLVNATDGGAKIKGFKHCRLTDVMRQVDGPTVKGRDRIMDGLRGFSRDFDLVERRLARLRRDTEYLSDLSEDQSLDLGDLISAVRAKPGPKMALGHLLGRPPKDEGLRSWIKSELRIGLNDLYKLACRLEPKVERTSAV
ncbi:MAG: 6-hydroxymethylpterin diphosphokinase MptE-like protein [Thermodesulfobacteriota bacterium]|nr:6-hydroxymethylpterin diphosphokinase MptE-like protein [Thermodesulfobacteriota bacterium]